jgi:hypothetical protein
MQFNLEVGPEKWLANVGLIGHMASVSIWRGDPINAAESQYRLQFGDAWVAKPDMEKGQDAIRVAVADTLANGFDVELITLVIENDSPRWPGRISIVN